MSFPFDDILKEKNWSVH